VITLIGCKNEFPGLHPASRQSFVYKTHILDDRVNVDKQTCLLTVCGFYDLLNEQVVKLGLPQNVLIYNVETVRL